MTKYGWKTEDEARKHVKVYAEDYQDLLEDNDIEAVVIACRCSCTRRWRSRP